MAEKHLRSTIQYQLNYQDNPIGTPLEWNEYFQAIKDSPIITGTNTSVTAGKLVDSGASFIPTKIGDIVVNTTSGNYAKITAKDSVTQLTLNSDVFAYTLQEYAIYRSPNIPNGWQEVEGQTITDPDSPFNGVVLFNPRSFKRIVSSNYTATAGDREIIVNPSLGAIDISVDPDINEEISVKVKHLGYGLIDRGDCEDTTAPMISGETVPETTNAGWSRSSTEFKGGTFSWAHSITSTGSESLVNFQDNSSTSDQHGLSDNQRYTFSGWIYVPSTGGPLPSEVKVQFGIYDGSNWDFINFTPTAIDSWQKFSITNITSTTGVLLRSSIDASASNGEVVYYDDIQLNRNYEVTISAPSGKSIEGSSKYTLIGEGDFLKIRGESKEEFFIEKQTGSTGEIKSFGRKSPPPGFVVCSGSELNRTNFSRLFENTGISWGAGDGSTTFNAPDLRGAFVRGTGTGTINGRNKSGPTIGSFQEDALQSHTHNIDSRGTGPDSASRLIRYDTTHGLKNASTDGAAARTASETRPYAAGVLYCIKV